MGRPTYGYRNAADRKVPGVTTILKEVSAGMDSDVLCGWAAKLAREGKDWKTVRNAAGAHGTILHDICEHHAPLPWDPTWPELLGVLPDQAAKLRASYAAICEWWKKETPHVIMAEEALVSEHWQYGGTMDAVVELAGEPWLLDYKTGSQVGVKEAAQMAAYRQLIKETKGLTVEGAVLIHVPTKNPGYLRAVRLDSDALNIGWSVFENALHLYRNIPSLKAVME